MPFKDKQRKKENSQRWYRENRERLIAQRREYQKTPKGKEVTKKARQVQYAKWRAQNAAKKKRRKKFLKMTVRALNARTRYYKRKMLIQKVIDSVTKKRRAWAIDSLLKCATPESWGL